jgi:hypothetical protein
MNFCNLPNPSGHTELRFTHSLAEVGTRGRKMFVVSRARPMRKVDNITAICEAIV